MQTLLASASSSLSLPPGSYIYSLTPAFPGSFAAISSDDSLRTFDAARLANASIQAPKSHADGVTSLRQYAPHLLVTGGRDGKVKLWDVRAEPGAAALEVSTDRNAPVLSSACNAATGTLVAGTELVSSQAVVAFWDTRAPTQPRLQYVESHNDDVTELEFHPSLNHILLSGSTDGLVNVYDSTIEDEDDALLQVINHGSVHHAGYLAENSIYALSHDEMFAIHPAVVNPDASTTDDPPPVQFGDVRDTLKCDYVVQLCTASQARYYLAAGNKIDQRLDLFPLVSGPSRPWQFDQEHLWRLPGAHGEEVVRSVVLDEESRAVFTCGEDGFVHAWKPHDGEAGEGPMDVAQQQQAQTLAAKAKMKGKKNKDKERFRPY